MPELLEVEAYRLLAEATVGRKIVGVETPDAWIIKGGQSGEQVRTALEGERFTATRRIGKLLLLDTQSNAVLGLRFGMTGVLELDGLRAITDLQYSSTRSEPHWVRFAVRFDDGGELRLRDPRRLGGVQIDPAERELGPDASTLTARELRVALGTSTAPLKARLMDQSRVAGLGNLLTDELLWRAGLDPARQAGSLSPAEMRRLHRHLRSTLGELTERGGSHTGDLQSARVRGGRCPRDGAELERRTVGGRTTYSCPAHQG